MTMLAMVSMMDTWREEARAVQLFDNIIVELEWTLVIVTRRKEVSSVHEHHQVHALSTRAERPEFGSVARYACNMSLVTVLVMVFTTLTWCEGSTWIYSVYLNHKIIEIRDPGALPGPPPPPAERFA